MTRCATPTEPMSRWLPVRTFGRVMFPRRARFPRGVCVPRQDFVPKWVSFPRWVFVPKRVAFPRWACVRRRVAFPGRVSPTKWPVFFRRVSARFSDRGSATVWSVGAVAVLCVVFGGVLTLGQAVVVRHRAAGGADLAALAAADHWAEGTATACARAGRVARAQGTRLLRCAIVEETADVTAAAGGGPIAAEVRARAGPAESFPQDPPPAPLPTVAVPAPAATSARGRTSAPWPPRTLLSARSPARAQGLVSAQAPARCADPVPDPAGGSVEGRVPDPGRAPDPASMSDPGSISDPGLALCRVLLPAVEPLGEGS